MTATVQKLPVSPTFTIVGGFQYDADTPWTTLCGSLFALLSYENSLAFRSGSNYRSLEESHLRLFLRHPAHVLFVLQDTHVHAAAKLLRRYNWRQLDTEITRVMAIIDAHKIPSMTRPRQAIAIHAAYASAMQFLRERWAVYQSAKKDSKEQTEIEPFDETADE